MNMTDEVCAHVAAADYAILDDFTVGRVKTRVLDAVGVTPEPLPVSPLDAELLGGEQPFLAHDDNYPAEPAPSADLNWRVTDPRS